MIYENLSVPAVRTPESVAAVVRSILSAENEVDRDKEHFFVFGCSASLGIKYVELVSLGTLTASIVHPREIFRLAVMKGIASLILAHNHPSGTLKPTIEDCNVTNRLKQAGDILGIQVLDHVIVSESGFYSFDKHNLLK